MQQGILVYLIDKIILYTVYINRHANMLLSTNNQLIEITHFTGLHDRLADLFSPHVCSLYKYTFKHRLKCFHAIQNWDNGQKNKAMTFQLKHNWLEHAHFFLSLYQPWNIKIFSDIWINLKNMQKQTIKLVFVFNFVK